jgi:hypothetical protein
MSGCSEMEVPRDPLQYRVYRNAYYVSNLTFKERVEAVMEIQNHTLETYKKFSEIADAILSGASRVELQRLALESQIMNPFYSPTPVEPTND